MEHDKYAIYIIWLVAIVGVVSLVAVFTGVNSQTVAGQAITTCFDSDNGINYHRFGTTTSILPGQGPWTYEDYCWNGEIVDSCDGCYIYDYYCQNGIVEKMAYLTDRSDGLHCDSGILVRGDLSDEPLIGGHGWIDEEEEHDNDETYTNHQFFDGRDATASTNN
jgi:hypothetical protein